MAEQPTQDQPECSAASVQTPDSLHIDLPQVDPEDVSFIILKCLLQLTREHWKLLRCNCVSSEILATLAFSCMDTVQTFAEVILDIVMPQVYSYMRTHDTISPTDFRVTKDQIQAYMGDSVEQALTHYLKINVQSFCHTKMFFQLLQEHILRTVNSVLALFTQSATLESRVPVISVSGCVTSITDLKHMVHEMAKILTHTLFFKQLNKKFTEQEINLFINDKKLDSPILCFNSRKDLKTQVRTYLIHRLKVLRNSLGKPCEISSRNNRAVCIRVGTDTKILTVGDSGSQGHMSPMDSYGDLNAIPGSVPEPDKASPSNGPTFTTLTITRTTEDQSSPLVPMKEMETITNVVDELMQALMDDLPPEEETGVALQLNAHHKDKIREITNRIFDLIMNGQDYQIPLVPAGTNVGDTITYRRVRRGDITDQGIVAHTLYLRTEEVVTRCALQMLLWLQINIQYEQLDLLLPSHSVEEISPVPYLSVPQKAAGDYVAIAENRRLPLPSPASNATIDVVPEPPEPTQSPFREEIVQAALVTLLISEMVAVIGVRNRETLVDLLIPVGQQLEGLGPQLHQHFHDYLMSQSYRNIFEHAIAELLLEYGSFQAMQNAVRLQDPIFMAAVARALRNQIRTLDEHSVSEENTAEKSRCSFFKKFKRLCCKKFSNKTSNTPVISLTVDQNNSELQEHLNNEDEPPEEETQQCLCSLMHRTASCIRKKCSTLRKRFSNFTRAMCRPFTCCYNPRSQ